MNQDTFVEEKSNSWKTLSSLLDRAKFGKFENFSAEEIRTLGSLYRKTSSDLSYARSKNYSVDLIRYLNQLTRRAYGIIYLGDSDHKSGIIRFFTTTFPQSIRKNFVYVLSATLLFSFMTIISYTWDRLEPSFAVLVVPKEFLTIWESTKRDDPYGAAAFPVMSSFYLTNNFRVGMMAFVTGILFGMGTLYLLSYNGLIFGALISRVIRINNHITFFSFITPHSFIELMAIFICGGAGFMIAKSMIAPGELKVRDSLYMTGKSAVAMVLGTIPMFLVAGIIEASFSRMQLPLAIKIAFGLFTVVVMVWYFIYFPKDKTRHKKYKL